MLARLAYLAVTNVLAAVSAFVTPKRLTRLPSSFAVDAVGHASFDAVLILETTLHFMPEPLFAEMARVLRPGGRVVIETPCVRAPLTDEMRSRLAAYFDMFQVLSVEPEEAYTRALRAAGLEIEATEDLTEHTEPFYGRILERFDCHRDELTAEYGVEAVERVESVISNCAAMSGMGSILLTGFKPAFPPLTG
ncbi:methyltransferase domain-containing protein [Nonomuraea angiospora]|uniref:methyltransferase domain-containing protein n=1 Tax=Nonomuraea angiospora TaxID=46172 RepID=UPI00331950C3